MQIKRTDPKPTLSRTSSMSSSPSSTVAKSAEGDFKSHPPEDKYNFVYWNIFLAGIVCMLPWDIMVTVTGYWHYKLSDGDEVTGDDDDLNEYQKEFLAYLGIASSIPSCVVYLANAVVGKKFGVHAKSVVAQTGIVATFCVIIVLAYLDTSGWDTSTFMVLNLVLAFIVNTFRAIFRVTNSSNLGKFPVVYISSLGSGICMGGMISVSINLVILSIDIDPQMAGFYAFVFSGAVVLLCFIMFFFMERTEFYQYYTYLSHNDNLSNKSSGKVLTIAWVKTILNKCWVFILALVVMGISTNCVYPSLTALIRPTNPNGSDWHEVYFVQVSCFLTWNICNYLGTGLAGLIQRPRGPGMRTQVIVLVLAVIRVAFVPFFMFCNLAPSDRTLPVYVSSDAAYIVAMVVFSFSDGYLKNIDMMFGPKTVGLDLQDVAASLQVMTLGISFALGSILSTPLVKAL